MKNLIAQDIQTYILTELQLDECTVAALSNLNLKELVKYWVQKNQLELLTENYDYRNNAGLIQLGIDLDIPGMKEKKELHLSNYEVTLNAVFQVSGVELEELKSHLNKWMSQKKISSYNPSHTIVNTLLGEGEETQDQLLVSLPDINLGTIKKPATANKYLDQIKELVTTNTDVTSEQVDNMQFPTPTEGLRKAKEMLLALTVKSNVTVS